MVQSYCTFTFFQPDHDRKGSVKTEKQYVLCDTVSNCNKTVVYVLTWLSMIQIFLNHGMKCGHFYGFCDVIVASCLQRFLPAAR
jgi:hypothetical protein